MSQIPTITNLRSLKQALRGVQHASRRICSTYPVSSLKCSGNGLGRVLAFFFFLDLVGVGDGGVLNFEATKVASALQGGYSLEFFELGDT